jgi:hypothetical protein
MKTFNLILDLVSLPNNESFYIKNEEIGGIEFDFTITNNDIPVDLTNATVLFVSLSPSGITNAKGCTITSAENGMAMVVLDAVEFFEVGEHAAEVRITKPFEVNITEKFYYTSIDAIDVP